MPFSSKTKPKKNYHLVKNPVFFRTGEKISAWSQSALSDRLFLLFLFGWLAPIILGLVYGLLIYGQLPEEIPLFYSRSWGTDQLANRIYIFLPAAGAFLLGTFNFGIAVSRHATDKTFSYLLTGTASLVSVLATITTINIINLIK